MSKPRPYILEAPQELKRLIHELTGYMKISWGDGTDREGRKYALDALIDIKAGVHKLVIKPKHQFMNTCCSIFLIIVIGWIGGYWHHYKAVEDIMLDRVALGVERNLAREEIRRYAGLVNYQIDIIAQQASEMADEMLLEGDRNAEFHQMCRELRANKPRTKGDL